MTPSEAEELASVIIAKAALIVISAVHIGFLIFLVIMWVLEVGR